MRIAVVGAGAMGTLLAGLLARAGAAVWLIGRDRAAMAAVAAGGIRIYNGADVLTAAVQATADPTTVGTVDLAVVAVKAGDTQAVAAGLMPLLGPHTLVLSLQNGLGNDAVLAAAVGAERVLAGVTAEGATWLGPGEVRHAGRGATRLGAVHPGARGRVAAVVALLQQAGLAAAAAADVQSVVWSKLVISCAINPLTALLGVYNGGLLELQPARELMAAAAREAARVAAAQGVELEHDDPVVAAEQVAAATAANRSSMLQDLERGRKTEVDAINGAVARIGERLGVAAPVNATLWRLIKAKEGCS